MKIENILRKNIEEYLLDQYSISSLNFDISRTKKDFVGHLTVVLFPLIPIIKAAGGIVTTWKNDDPKKAGNIICSANKSLHNKILKILKPVSK